MKPQKICLHPLFRVNLVQMLRHGEIYQASAKATDELLLALQNASGGDEGAEDGSGTAESGVVMVPLPARIYELGYLKKPPEIDNPKRKGTGYDYGR